MLSTELKQQVLQLPIDDRLELIQTIVASLQAAANAPQKPLSLAAIRDKVNQLGPDPDAPTLEELSQLVRTVRQEA